MKTVSEAGDQDGASAVDRLQTVNTKTTVGAFRMGADRFQ